MKEVEYIIVGQGIAGSCFAFYLLENKKSFIIIDDNHRKASTVAAGVYNPVVLKRFSPIWNAEHQLNKMYEFFLKIEKLLGKNYVVPMPTYRIFHDEDEAKTWQKKSMREDLIPFVNPEILHSENSAIYAPHGMGEVLHSGKVEIKNFLDDFRDYLIQKEIYTDETFDYSQLKIENDSVYYKNIQAKKILFAEGFGVKNNPYFKDLPIIGLKGEVLQVELDEDLESATYKTRAFLVHKQNREFFIGTTYERDNLDYEPTEDGKNSMLENIFNFYKGGLKLLDHQAGIRPTVIDRRPILGSHSLHKNVYILNGMGTRGLLLGCSMAEDLYLHIENNKDLDKIININRFFG